MKVLLAGSFGTHTLETSYKNAFIDEGLKVEAFDIPSTISKYIKFGKAGQILNTFLPVEAWQRKANRDFVIKAKEYAPDVIVIVTNALILPSSIAFLRSILPQCKMILIWPDTLFNLQSHVLQSAPLYDLVATYSSNSLNVFHALGFKKVKWVPLAADPHLHYRDWSTDQKTYDITFVGGWRPEREQIMSHIISNFSSAKIGIWGPYWNRSNNKSLRNVADKNPLYASAFSDVIRKSRINMNIIDDTNFPAANMRFFEIPVAGGLQLSSKCPEMESVFHHGEHIFYYGDNDELVDVIDQILSYKINSNEIAKNAQELVLAAHTYRHRVKQILSEL
ncbi:MAG: glycosyltransferase [Ignavibacteria bacterium]|nr:glycosyltransferase [Ignavibacteria bacterium]